MWLIRSTMWYLPAVCSNPRVTSVRITCDPTGIKTGPIPNIVWSVITTPNCSVQVKEIVAQYKVVYQHVRSNWGKHGTLSTPIRLVGVPAEILIFSLLYIGQKWYRWSQNNFTSDADGQPADQNTAHVICKPKVHYRVHNSPNLGPFAVRFSPVHKPTGYEYFLKNNFSSLYPVRE
jgi:hypothetical protein